MNKNGESKAKLTLKDASIVFDVLVLLMVIFSLCYSAVFQNVEGESILKKTFSYLCSPLAIIGAVGLLCFRKRQNILPLLTPRRVELNATVATAFITLGMLFGLSELNNIFVELLTKLGFTLPEMSLPELTPLNLTLVIITVCILPAFFEELIFRGAILKGLASGGKLFALLLSGGLFSIFHMSPLQTVYQFAVGVLYALIVLNGGDWFLTFFSHLINNLFIVFNYYFFSFYPTGGLKIALTALGLLSLLFGIALLVKRNVKYDKAEKKSNFISSFPIGVIICVFMWVAGLVA